MRIMRSVLLLLLATTAQAVQFSKVALPTQQATAPVVIAAAAGRICVAGSVFTCSGDGGATWTGGLPVDPALGISQLALDPSNGSIVYALGSPGPLRSDDGGATWRAINAGLPKTGFRPVRLLVDPRSPSTLYLGATCPIAGEQGGFFRSTDGGNSWLQLLGPSSVTDCVDTLNIDPLTSELFYRDMFNGHHRSVDGGTTWTPSSTPLPALAMAIEPADSNRRQGTTLRFSQGHVFSKFLASNDGGATWSDSTSGTTPFGIAALTIDPATRRLFATASDGIYWTDDRGATWQKGAATPYVSNVVAAGGFVFAGSIVGLYRAAPAAPSSWSVMNAGGSVALPMSVYPFAIDPRDPETLFAFGTVDAGYATYLSRPVVRSRNGGLDWEILTAEGDLTKRETPVVDAAGDLFAKSDGTLWRYPKNGTAWESWSVPQIGELFANPQRPGWLYTRGAGAFYSADGGHSWTPMNGLQDMLWLDASPNGLDLYAGSSAGGVFASNDGGVTWRNIANETDLFTYRIAVAPSRPSTIYRVTGRAGQQPPNILYRSDDSGATWTRLQWPAESWCCPGVLVVDPLDWRSVWMATLPPANLPELAIPMAHSTDGGITWKQDSNLKFVSSLSITSDGSTIYAVIDGALWKGTLRTIRRRASGR